MEDNTPTVIRSISSSISHIIFMIDTNLYNSEKQHTYSFETFKDMIRDLYEFAEEEINCEWYEDTEQRNKELYVSLVHEIEIVNELVKKFDEITPINVISEELANQNEYIMYGLIERFLKTAHDIILEITY